MYASIQHQHKTAIRKKRNNKTKYEFASRSTIEYKLFTRTNSSTERLQINISGRIYEMYENLVDNWPQTLLGNQQLRLKHFDYYRKEFFFDRNCEAFEGILFFYQSNGYLRCPAFVLMEIFYEECKFFGILDCLNDATMCDTSLLGYIKEQEDERIKTLPSSIKNRYDFDNNRNTSVLIEPKSKFRKFFWMLIERPHESIFGRLFGFTCFTCVVLSVFLLCYETYSDSQEKPKLIRINHLGNDIELNAKIICKNDVLRKELSEAYVQIKEACSVINDRKIEFFTGEIICNLFFTLELIVQFIATIKFRQFITHFSNIIDLIIILPFWIDFGITLMNANDDSKQSGLAVLKLLRVSRVFRVLKLSNHLKILKLIGKILVQCIPDILLLLTFLLSNLVLFSTIIYYIELFMLEEKSPFISIPDAFWWAIISFTSIGYGDLIPASNVGKFFGSLFVLCGILIAFLPVPILSAKFEKIYKEIAKLNRRKRVKKF